MTLTVADLQQRVFAYARQAVAAGVISEARIAIAIHISQPHLHHLLKGKRRPRAEHADAIARALGITALDLYTLDELRELMHHAIDQTRARMDADLEMAAALELAAKRRDHAAA